MRLTPLVTPGFLKQTGTYHLQRNVCFDGRLSITCAFLNRQRSYSLKVFSNIVLKQHYAIRLRLALNVPVLAEQNCVWERELSCRILLILITHNSCGL